MKSLYRRCETFRIDASLAKFTNSERAEGARRRRAGNSCPRGVLSGVQKEQFLPHFQVPKFENSESEKMQFHTPSLSIPPLDSLLILESPFSSLPP